MSKRVHHEAPSSLEARRRRDLDLVAKLGIARGDRVERAPDVGN